MNKKILQLTAFIALGLSTVAMSQENTSDVKYRRSSLHTVLIEASDFPNKNTVVEAFNNAPFPDKYNNHSLEEKSFDPKDYGYVAPADFVESIINPVDIAPYITKYLKEKGVAKSMVSKWFDQKTDGSFDMKLIGERGFYNASEMEKNIAKNTTRGTASLADAGAELINNSFIVVSDVTFFPNELVALPLKEAALLAANKITNSFGQTAAIKAAEVAYEKGKVGYSVWTTSYLYKLKWNEEIANTFYSEMWSNPEAFKNSDIFELEFIGKDKASSLVTLSLTNMDRTESEIITIATTRNIDAVFAKLQREYDVFKPKTPLLSGGKKSTAKIGLKEGIEAGDKFNVLEQTVNEKTGLTEYKKIGTAKVKKGQIWDNRYNASENTGADEEGLEFTTFKGSKKYYKGLLLQQI